MRSTGARRACEDLKDADFVFFAQCIVGRSGTAVDRNRITLLDERRLDLGVGLVVSDVQPRPMRLVTYPYSIPLVAVCVDMRPKPVPARPARLTAVSAACILQANVGGLGRALTASKTPGRRGDTDVARAGAGNSGKRQRKA